jgi:protein xylosyltransferase
VGTGWDEKERIFRNYGRLMGPWDTPVLVHYWKKGTPFNVKLMWIDPISVITGVYEMNVKDDWVVSFHKPEYHKPLRPGTWTVKMVYRQQGGTDLVIGQTTFLVLPLAFKGGILVDSEQAIVSNGGPPAGRYTKQYTIEFDRESTNIDVLANGASLNSKKIGQDLHEWIDILVKENWAIEDACVVGNEVNECDGLATCSMTSWSSRSPDPKSEIGQVSVNGTLR